MQHVVQQLERAVLRALSRPHGNSPNLLVDRLLLTLAWGRVDVARREIFHQVKLCRKNYKILKSDYEFEIKQWPMPMLNFCGYNYYLITHRAFFQ